MLTANVATADASDVTISTTSRELTVLWMTTLSSVKSGAIFSVVADFDFTRTSV